MSMADARLDSVSVSLSRRRRSLRTAPPGLRDSQTSRAVGAVQASPAHRRAPTHILPRRERARMHANWGKPKGEVGRLLLTQPASPPIQFCRSSCLFRWCVADYSRRVRTHMLSVVVHVRDTSPGVEALGLATVWGHHPPHT